MAGCFLKRTARIYSRFDCTFASTVSVTPKNEERVPSSPDTTSGMSNFRISIAKPKPNALKIPIILFLGRGILFDDKTWG